MPKRPDIRRVLIIGSGPIVIGQACEFDYSGVQACKALREEGIAVVLVNSNPATIMTDPEFADRTYVEPVTPDVIEKILEKERKRGTPIDSVLPTLGGQTGLNCAMACHRAGIFEKHGVRLLAATPEAIQKAEDRQAFKAAMLKIGLDVARSGIAHSWEEAQQVVKTVGLPCAIRPGFTLGGTGGGFAHTPKEFEEICKRGLEYSPTHELLIEESLWGWKEFELEVMRDRADNVVIICSIENFDPMGVHTGDSITVAPAQTLTDREYQRMRDASLAIIREIGVETGGSNIQFAVNPKTGRMCVIEMNPRVSRSSALASKATGFPIAKIATKLAIGYTLDEIPNDITKTTPACFEPALDYCVVKIPRWNFEKFPEADETLTTQMKSVGEAMAIGRTFKEALQKCIRSMEIKRFGLGLDEFDAWLRHAEGEVGTWEPGKVGTWERGNVGTESAAASAARTTGSAARKAASAASVTTTVKKEKAGAAASSLDVSVNIADLPENAAAVPTFPPSHVPPPPPVAGWRDGEAPADTVEQQAASWPIPDEVLRDKLARPAQGRLYYVRYALKQGWPISNIHELSSIDPWFLENMRQLAEFEKELLAARGPAAEVFKFVAQASNLESVAQASSLCSGARASSPQHRQDAGVTPHWLEASSTQTLAALLRRAKSFGYSNVQLARVWKTDVDTIRRFERDARVAPLYRLVDTCAAEFAAQTPYYYSTHEGGNVERWEGGNGAGAKPDASSRSYLPTFPRSHAPDELRRSHKPKVVVLGGGPNRIGQGIEFDYCCVHAALAAKELGYEAVMVNSNPETVSTDYDTSDLLFFEPLTQEDVLNVCERLNGRQLSPEILLLDATGLREHPRDFPEGVVRKVARSRFELEDALWERIKAELPRLKLREAAVIAMVLSPAQSANSACQIVYLLALDERVFALGFNAESPPQLVKVEEVGREARLSVEKLIGPDVLDRARRLLREARGDLQGVICQFGGQTPLNLAMSLQRAGVTVLGTNPEAIHAAEDREQFARILDELGLQSPPSGIARSFEEAREVAERVGYPVLVRPSFVLGGRAMEICNNVAELRHYMAHAVEASGGHPILIDRFLSDATEVDVDAVSDGQRVVICGVLEHIEEAGIHSGDSAMTLPPYSLSAATVQQLSYATQRLALRIGVVGLMNVQFAIKEDDIYVLEVNPRASRTIPFIAKATGVPWAKIAAKVILGKTLAELGVNEPPPRRHIAVKVSVFPFEKFPGVDVVLGPEMRSTGEVMGVDERFSLAFAKAQMAASIGLPMGGKAFVSVNENDRPFIAPIARDLARLGFELVCTVGTGSVLRAAGLKATIIRKIRDVTPNAPNTPNPLELIESGQIAMVLNTPGRTGRHTDEGKIRAAAVSKRIPIFTTITGAKAAVAAIGALKRRSWEVYALQDLWM